MAYIGRRLREARKARGLTQDQLGELAVIPRTDISAFENDHKSVGHERLARLARALDVSVLELAPEAEPDAKGLLFEDHLEEQRARVDALLKRERRLADQVRDLSRRVADLEDRAQPRSSRSRSS